MNRFPKTSTKHRLLRLAALRTLAPAVLSAQRPDPVQAYVDAHRPQVLDELVPFLRHSQRGRRHVADDSTNIRRNAAAVVEMMERRGIRTGLPEDDGPPMSQRARRAGGIGLDIL